MRKKFIGGLMVFVLFSCGWYFASSASKPAAAPEAGTTAEEISGTAFRVTLGATDEEPREWSGSISLSSGELRQLKGWHFAENDGIEGTGWKASSKEPTRSRGVNPATPPIVEPLSVLAVGVETVVEAPASSRVRITTSQGDFTFSLNELTYGRPLVFLDGAARVERQPVNQLLTTRELEDEHPSVAVGKDGTVHAAWIAYGNLNDQVLLRSLKNGGWSAPVPVSEAGDHFGTALAEDGQGRLWVVWSERKESNWELKARSFKGGEWSDIVQLTHNPAPDIFHSLAAGKEGTLAVTWMSFRDGQSDIYLKSWNGSNWSGEVRINESSANDWEPSVAIDSRGGIWVAWDSYERGSYNVLLRRFSQGQLGDLVRVTDSARYHARPSVAVDGEDRVWVAWEESEANWGKDYGYLATALPWQEAGNPLYRSRRVRVAVLEEKTLKTTGRDLMEAVPAPLRQYVQLPQLVADAQGRIWCFLRLRSFVRTETADVWAAGGLWNVYLTVYADGRWWPAIPFSESVGPNYMRVGAALAPDGTLWCAWPTDGRRFSNPPVGIAAYRNMTPNTLRGFGAVPENYEIFIAALDPAALRGGPAAPGELALLRPDLASAAPVHPHEDEDVQRIRNYEIRSGGKVYRLYRGDMHRHTDISADGAGDGSVFDLFRYALDAARMDYAMVTDHNSGYDQEYSWWRIEKANDLFHLPGSFTTLFGYERSLGYPNGHRNVAFAQRGVRTLSQAEGEQPRQGEVQVNTGSVLYPYLRENRGIAFSHTSHTGMGTDWRDSDPELEPLVEIFQGMRTSAEYEGAPKAPLAGKPETHQGGYRPAGFVWNAWAKGLKLGVQASSDHISTHISYSCIIAEEGSREGLMTAMRRRHAYAATDNIILDVRMQDGSQEYLQGDAFQASEPARLWVKIIGTRPIKDVQVIKNNRFIYSRNPAQRELEFLFADTNIEPGESYYYVRVVQEDDQVAWSSPLWVAYSSAAAGK